MAAGIRMYTVLKAAVNIFIARDLRCVPLLRDDSFSDVQSSNHMNLNSKKDITEIKPEKASKKSRLLPEGSGELKAAAVDEMEIQSTGRRMGKEMIVKRDPFPPALATMAASMVVDAAMEIPPIAIVNTK